MSRLLSGHFYFIGLAGKETFFHITGFLASRF